MLVPFVPAACLTLLCAASLSFAQPPAQVEPGPFLKQLVVEGATVFTADDVEWVLDLREGARLPGPPRPRPDWWSDATRPGP